MKTKAILFILIIIGALVFSIIYYLTPKDICDEFGVIYLKESEKQFGSALANEENAIIVYPEVDRIIARNEMVECPIFKFKDHLRLIE